MAVEQEQDHRLEQEMEQLTEVVVVVVDSTLALNLMEMVGQVVQESLSLKKLELVLTHQIVGI